MSPHRAALRAAIESQPAPLCEGTSTVYRLPLHGLVARVAERDVDAAALDWQVEVARRLARAGVPFAVPIDVDHPTPRHRGITYWADLGPGQPLDWHAFGHSTRLLHDQGVAALTGIPVPDAEDVIEIAETFRDQRDAGLLSTDEYAALAPWPGRVQAWLDRHPAAERVVVHDDLWAKNVVQVGASAYLLDPDNIGLGRREHDLAFVVRGVEAGAVSDDQAAAFAAGYGAPLPDLDTAWHLAFLHRLRWVALLVSRRTWLARARDVLGGEIPQWTRPDGPRPTGGRVPVSNAA